MMPGMDGIEAVRIIREEIRTDYAQNIPIIALTANAVVGNEEIFLSKGFQAFISKPIDVLKLNSVLRQWVRDKDSEKNIHDDNNELHNNNLNGFDNGNGPQSENDCDSFLEGMEIAGLDIWEGLTRFNYDEELFIDIMRSFTKTTRLLLSNLADYLIAEDLEEYATVVHGIKGSSYGISANEVGKAAEALEVLATEKNLAAVKAGQKPFEEITSALLDEIDAALSAIDDVISKPLRAAPDPVLLQELREACKAFDMDRVDRAIEQLESFKYESGDKTVTWLREQIDNMTFENVYDGEWP